MWLSILEIGEAQLLSFMEIAPKSHVLMCERPASPILLMVLELYFSARTNMRWSVDLYQRGHIA